MLHPSSRLLQVDYTHCQVQQWQEQVSLLLCAFAFGILSCKCVVLWNIHIPHGWFWVCTRGSKGRVDGQVLPVSSIFSLKAFAFATQLPLRISIDPLWVRYGYFLYLYGLLDYKEIILVQRQKWCLLMRDGRRKSYVKALYAHLQLTWKLALIKKNYVLVQCCA